MRIRSLVAGAAVALAALPAGSASAEADHTETLRTICDATDGTWVPHPFFWRARCYGARPSGGADDGLRAPSMICSMQMAGTFHWSVLGDGSTSWICV